jgi:hypothetical protein
MFNVQLVNTNLPGNVLTSDQTIDPYLVRTRNLPVARLSSKLADTIPFRVEESLLFA